MEYNFVKAQAIQDAQRTGKTVGLYKSDSGQWQFVGEEFTSGLNIVEYISQYYFK